MPDDGKDLQFFVRSARRDDAVKKADNDTGEASEEGGGSGSGGAMSMQSTPASVVFGRDAPPLFYIETYGCQMNVSDSEIIASVLQGTGYERTEDLSAADVILANTCAIRENAEQRVLSRLTQFRHLKETRPRGEQPVVGVLGCMAERMKTTLLETERSVDIVVGPDAYRDLPNLIQIVRGGHSAAAVNVQLSQDETYADIAPVRLSADRHDAFVSIMRGCNNMCSFCIVPFTRGRERSREVQSIVDECRRLAETNGVREIVLLGQNVNSYHDAATPASGDWSTRGYETAAGFGNLFKARDGSGVRFAELLQRVAEAVPDVRIRFTSPHPKDFPQVLLQLMAETPNICKSIHLPAQSGSTAVLERMRRNYTREAYLQLANQIRATLPGVSLSTDMISGFCGESEADHQDTLSLMREVRYENAFMFAYSRRERTHAARHLQDDVPEDVKLRRLQEVIAVYRQGLLAANEAAIGSRHVVLIDGPAKRSTEQAPSLQGRTDSNRRVVIPEDLVAASFRNWAAFHGSTMVSTAAGRDLSLPTVPIRKGDFVVVDIVKTAGKTLVGAPIARLDSLRDAPPMRWDRAVSDAWT